MTPALQAKTSVAAWPSTAGSWLQPVVVRPLLLLLVAPILYLAQPVDAEFQPAGVDAYEALGLSPADSLDAATVKRAYRKAALRWHPDKVPSEKRKEAEQRFLEIAWAYETLSDPTKRAVYDAQQRQGAAGGSASAGSGASHPGPDFDLRSAARVFREVFGESAAEYHDLVNHLARASTAGDRQQWRKHAEDIKRESANKANFNVETVGRNGETMKTSHTVSDDGRGTTTRKTVTTHSKTTGSAGTPELATHPTGATAIDAHTAAHQAAVEAAQRAHEAAVRTTQRHLGALPEL